MARFNLGSLFGNERFENFQDVFARFSGGTSGADELVGSTRNNTLSAGAGDDELSGMAGRDNLNGGSGNDHLWGGSGNDTLTGGNGADMLLGGMGSDRMEGGSGADTLVSRSDAGEQVAAQDGSTIIFGQESAALRSAASDTMVGGSGSDAFRFEFLVNAKEEIVAKHINDDGTIDWVGVTGENGATHDHWVDSVGGDTIRDFSKAQGDEIQLSGHTVEVQSIQYRDVNGDGRQESIITVISQQGNAGAHDEDALGTITVYGDLVTEDDIEVDQTVYGAYESVDSVPDGVHFTIEDNGVLPNGGTDHHG